MGRQRLNAYSMLVAFELWASRSQSGGAQLWPTGPFLAARFANVRTRQLWIIGLEGFLAR